MSDYDVIVAGGGLVGISAAVGLARTGRRVALVEPRDPQASRQSVPDDRTLVLNAASLNILSNLGLLTDAMVRLPVRTIEISRAGGFGHLSLVAAEHGRDCFGAVVVAAQLGQVLREALHRQAGVEVYCPATLVAIERQTGGVLAKLNDGRQLPARVLVGADGNRSDVRRLAGLICRVHDYCQSAMVLSIEAARAPRDTAWERFTADGPLALLPQPAGRLGVVWIDWRDQLDTLLAWSDKQLIDALAKRAGSGPWGFRCPGRRSAYPLVRHHTPWPVAKRVVVIGNAANAVHPVSAQGLNLGLRDAAGLIDRLGPADDPGDPLVLTAYARDRASDQQATLDYTDTLARAFTNPSGAARLLGGLGLAAHAAVPMLQRRLVQAAMGFREPVSPLALTAGAGRR